MRLVWRSIFVACIVWSAPAIVRAATVDDLGVAATAPVPRIVGTVVDRATGRGIGGASLALLRDGALVASVASSEDGAFAIAGEPAGAYEVVVSANGYRTVRDRVVLADGRRTTARYALAALASSQNDLRRIGRASVRDATRTLETSATIQRDVRPDELAAQGALSAADALGRVPGVNASGSSHGIGDDAFIDIRGYGVGETRPLLDGHGIGPLGVGGPDTYNYVNAPYFLLRNIQTTAGSGAAGLYGVDVIGGTIDFQTLDPTATTRVDASQSFANAGTAVSQLKATGTVGKLGFALGHAVSGTYGAFAPQSIFQSGRPNNDENLPNHGACTAGNDLTTCDRRLNTYDVSANDRVQNDLVKLRFDASAATALSLTAYASNQLSDATGAGDNDAVPYDTRLAEILATAPTCAGGRYAVVTDANPHACYTAAQFAAASSGPFGGGADRSIATSLQDLHARLTTRLSPRDAVTVDAYRGRYAYVNNSTETAGLDATRTYFVGGGTFRDAYLTDGLLVTNDLTGRTSDVTLGYSVEHQRESGDAFTAGPPPAFVPQQEYGSGGFAFFARGRIDLSAVTLFANASLRRDLVTEKTTFDPRLSLVAHPSKRDVVRVTAGRADGDPAASIKATGGLTNVGNASSLSPSCTLLNPVASGGNPNLQPESASDVELAANHDFSRESTFGVVAYVSSERNRFFTGTQPLAAFGPLATQNPALASTFGAFATRIDRACGTAYDARTVQRVLGITTTFNAASALYRGVELTGRLRLAPALSLGFAYDVQSARLSGVPDALLAGDPFLVNDAQIYEIPVHSGNVTLDYAARGFAAQLLGAYVGDNNTNHRPQYTYVDGFVSRAFGALRATLGATNLFAQNVQRYGYYGHQLEAPTNRFFPAPSTPVGQAVALGNLTQLEEFGLAPRLVTFTFGARL